MSQTSTPTFDIQRLYVKDMSYEAPNTPQTFTEEWKPEVQLNLESKSTRIQENVHEVVLTLTATVTTQNKTAFLIEVHQAGVFHISGFPDAQTHQMLGSFCPTILFPYARSLISNTVMLGGFPQLILAPVNFDALYEQHLRDKQPKEAVKTDGSDGETQIH